MTFLESVLRSQSRAAEREKLREAEDVARAVILKVADSRGVALPLNGRVLVVLVTDEDDFLRLQFVGDELELEGDARRDVLFALVREVGE